MGWQLAPISLYTTLVTVRKNGSCIAGVLAMRPEVLILDEPMVGLDFAMQAELMQILDRLHTERITIIIATHDMTLPTSGLIQ